MRNFKKKDYLILFANCIPVKGHRRSTICDLQRNKFYLIPNDLYSILRDINKKTILEIYAEFGLINKKTIDSYLSFILDNELGFVDSKPKLFPQLKLDWNAPSKITNAIIEINKSFVKGEKYDQLIYDLNILNCSCVQIRCFSLIDVWSIDKFIDLFSDNRINEIRFFLKFDIKLDLYFKSNLEKFSKISSVCFFGCNNLDNTEINNIKFSYLKNEKIDNNSCGNVCQYAFNANIYQFTESQNHNSCLNRKISVDKFGFIKNCPSQKTNFGNILDNSIIEIITNENFKKLWAIKKDDIKVCQDCEFRYICTDCRVFIEEEDNILSKPSKCSYNPYVASWDLYK